MGASMTRDTNTKFIVRVMDHASTGPLMQAFVLEALRNYSADILATETPPDAETGFISWNCLARMRCRGRPGTGRPSDLIRPARSLPGRVPGFFCLGG
jgi:hypothetical protein